MITHRATAVPTESAVAPVRPRLEFLDWLRALAVLLVVLGHSARPLAPGGALGVSVFFAISGFLIASILLEDGMLTAQNVGKFITRRVARIYPMYALHIAATCVFLYMYKPAEFETAWAALPGMLTFLKMPTGWLGYAAGVLWTLQVEFWFYVTFPVLLIVGVATRMVFPCILVAFTLCTASKLLGWSIPIPYGGEAFAYYDHLLLGAAAAAAVRFNVTPSFLKHRYGFAIGLALVLGMAVIPFTERDLLWHAKSLAVATGTSVAILSAMTYRPNAHVPIFSFIGRVSYSVYLVHALVLDAFVLRDPMMPNVLLYLIVVLAISTITYQLIEQPFIRFVHRNVRFIKAPSPGA